MAGEVWLGHQLVLPDPALLTSTTYQIAAPHRSCNRGNPRSRVVLEPLQLEGRKMTGVAALAGFQGLGEKEVNRHQKESSSKSRKKDINRSQIDLTGNQNKLL